MSTGQALCRESGRSERRHKTRPDARVFLGDWGETRQRPALALQQLWPKWTPYGVRRLDAVL